MGHCTSTLPSRQSTLRAKSTFALVSASHLANPLLTPRDRHVLTILLEHARGKAVCWPSIARLASLCHCNERTIQRALARLKEAGVIKERYGDHGKVKREILIVERLEDAKPAPAPSASLPPYSQGLPKPASPPPPPPAKALAAPQSAPQPPALSDKATAAKPHTEAPRPLKTQSPNQSITHAPSSSLFLGDGVTSLTRQPCHPELDSDKGREEKALLSSSEAEGDRGLDAWLDWPVGHPLRKAAERLRSLRAIN